MNDYLGQEIKIGDRCAYLINMRTGSSTIRKVLLKGVVSGTTKEMVRIGDHLVHPSEVIVLRPNAIWVDYMDTVCSNCGFECSDTYYLGDMVACPNCGARIVGKVDISLNHIHPRPFIEPFNNPDTTVDDWIKEGFSVEEAKEICRLAKLVNSGGENYDE